MSFYCVANIQKIFQFIIKKIKKICSFSSKILLFNKKRALFAISTIQFRIFLSYFVIS